MSSRGHSPLPRTPAANNNPLTADLLSRGRSRPRAAAISASRALSMGKTSTAAQFTRKSASRGRRQIVEPSNASFSPYITSNINNDSTGNNFYLHSQSITPGGILSDMQTPGSLSYQSNVSSSPIISHEELDVNILYRDAVEDDLEGQDLDLESEAAKHKRATKIERQWTKWSQETIPALLQPYMILMEETQSLRDTSKLQNIQLCKGCENGRLLNVSCVFFNSA